ncbi:sugar ABC transporter substrate-binding protein [Paracoccus sp. P2]|uniref:sugar ABC transporter substrate-binding protein n=1 Tax=Paracoccus sp. P2 TaxID=3248840 RepID=UPI00391FBF2E
MKLTTSFKGTLGFTTALVVLASAASAEAPALAFIITNAQNPAEISMREGFEKKGGELGAEVRILNASGSVEAMSNAIDDMIAQGVQGIATITMDSVVSMSWVDRANDANIPYVSVAVQVGDPATTPFKDVYPGLSALVGQDYIVSGQRMAEAVAPLLPEGKTAKIGIVEGQAGYALVAQLNQGFNEKLKELGADYQIVFSQPTDWTPAKGQEVCANGLIANPDIDVIFSHAEDMAIGCAQAINDAGSSAKLVTAAGGSKLGTPLIKTGDIDISMCEAWIRTGELAAEALFQAATDSATPKGRLIEYKPELITAENTDTVCPPQW